MTIGPDVVRRWGRYAESSPLYTHLVEVIARDADLMRVLNRIQNTPAPNLLFGAVAYLLLENPDAELGGYYPNRSPASRPIAGIDHSFREFVLEHEERIVGIGGTRYTQTNECRRCVALLPGIWAGPADEFHLVDLGTSAGLNLALDLYSYAWDGITWGPASAVKLATELRGEAPRPRPIRVLSRIGLDLNPIDTGDPDELRWLESLIWPEQQQRRERLERAWQIARATPMDLVAGDALATLPEVISGLPTGEPVVVMSSFFLNQLTPEQTASLDELIADLAPDRLVHRVSLELMRSEDDWATLKIGDGSGSAAIGRAHHHGEWVDLYALP